MIRGLLKGSIGPKANDSRFLLDVHRREAPGQETMARYQDSDEVDLVVVGAGAGGSVLAQRLARHGWRIVVLEAGPFWHPDEGWVSDEAGSHRLYWTQERVIGGADPIEMGKNNSGRGGGGSIVRYTGYCPRFHPSDFSTQTDPGRGFARGFSIQTVSPMPIGWAEHVLADGHWGRALREYMRDYNHWAVIGVLNELLPEPENRVTLADEHDAYGLPVARLTTRTARTTRPIWTTRPRSSPTS